MTESTLIGIAIYVYLASWIGYLLDAAFRRRWSAVGADLLVVCGLSVHALAIGLRWAESYRLGMGHAPLSNLYESMVFFSWALGVVYLLALRKLRARILGVFVMPLVFLALASTSLMHRGIEPLMPALQSNWLTAHVI
ncbi:MAG: cytochrome c biogenesis protein CcsA [bacterium]